MNEGRLFLYVSPKVALPFMFLVLVLTSLTVHFAILTNTTWFAAFWQGAAGEVAKAPAAPAMEAAASAAASAEATPAP
ncbi:light-harvesting protein [Novosphingobium sp. Chol11]|uniref:light-harvesting protein n=1 Tax=Novosphingobium sp. Chol11 TaxID=1385763 RepID=UPI0025E1A0C6|nr:light-harvesting protein [Novosphingobium sp. Chol11]